MEGQMERPEKPRSKEELLTDNTYNALKNLKNLSTPKTLGDGTTNDGPDIKKSARPEGSEKLANMAEAQGIKIYGLTSARTTKQESEAVARNPFSSHHINDFSRSLPSSNDVLKLSTEDIDYLEEKTDQRAALVQNPETITYVHKSVKRDHSIDAARLKIEYPSLSQVHTEQQSEDPFADNASKHELVIEKDTSETASITPVTSPLLEKHSLDHTDVEKTGRHKAGEQQQYQKDWIDQWVNRMDQNVKKIGQKTERWVEQERSFAQDAREAYQKFLYILWQRTPMESFKIMQEMFAIRKIRYEEPQEYSRRLEALKTSTQDIVDDQSIPVEHSRHLFGIPTALRAIKRSVWDYRAIGAKLQRLSEEECLENLGGTKEELLRAFKKARKKALKNAALSVAWLGLPFSPSRARADTSHVYHKWLQNLGERLDQWEQQ